MLWILFIVLVVAWAVAWAGFHVIGWAIHLLLVAALIVLIIRLVQGRRAVP
jgi:hypothetical protein